MSCESEPCLRDITNHVVCSSSGNVSCDTRALHPVVENVCVHDSISHGVRTPNASTQYEVFKSPAQRDSHKTCASQAGLKQKFCVRTKDEKFHEDTLQRTILDSLLEAEDDLLLHGQGFTDVQSEVTSAMRTTLVEWLIEVAEEYSLVSETLHLAVTLMDRFLNIEDTPRKSLQLLGITCVLIASKLEEIYAPSVAELCYITDNTYSVKQLIAMERTVLKSLYYRVCLPTSKTFCNIYCAAMSLDYDVEYLSNFLCETTLLSTELCVYRASIKAKAAIMISYVTLRGRIWIPDNVRTDLIDLVKCALGIIRFAEENESNALHEKFSGDKLRPVTLNLSDVSFEAALQEIRKFAL